MNPRPRRTSTPLSPLERMSLILSNPTDKHPFPKADWKAPQRHEKRFRRRRKPSLDPLPPHHQQESTNHHHGWAADTIRITEEIYHGSTSILDTIKAAELVQRAFRLRQWRRHMAIKFYTLCHYRYQHEVLHALRIQCHIRMHLAHRRVQRIRLDVHTTKARHIQHVARSFMRNQRTKIKLRCRLLTTIRSLIPGGNRISDLLRRRGTGPSPIDASTAHTAAPNSSTSPPPISPNSPLQRRPSRSHRGAITETELDVLQGLSGIGLRLVVHQTWFVELLKALKRVQSIDRTVHQRHRSYQNRRTFAAAFSHGVVQPLVQRRVLDIEACKIKRMRVQDQCRARQDEERERERLEREHMFYEEHLLLVLATQQRRRAEAVIQEKDRMHREKMERTWREAVAVERVEKWKRARVVAVRGMVTLNIEQALYLVGLRVRGERNQSKGGDVDEGGGVSSSIQVVHGKRVRVYLRGVG